MIINSGEEASFTNNTQEGGSYDDKASTSSRLTSALKSQRIVRVSRVFGGKDRHTKVSTVRGLRDRRVRLSVPTAIQLYDLQDKLGLNQPSKVVDWLLDAAQHEIDKLPPLQMPPGNFIQFPQMVPHEAPRQPTGGDRTDVVSYSRAQQLAVSSSMANGNVFNNNNVDVDLMALPKSTATYWSTADTNHMRMNPKEATREASIDQQDNITRGNDTVMQASGAPYTSYHQWRPSNGCISHLGSHLSQEEATHLFYPLPMFAPNYDAKQYNYLHMASLMPQDLSGSSNLKPSQDSSAPSRKP